MGEGATGGGKGAMGVRFPAPDAMMTAMVLLWQDNDSRGEAEVIPLGWRRGAQWGQGRKER